jgi:hypothetical protein
VKELTRSCGGRWDMILRQEGSESAPPPLFPSPSCSVGGSGVGRGLALFLFLLDGLSLCQLTGVVP